MFRKLYWVTEEVEADGKSRVSGVFTSIPDLLRHGLRWPSGNSALRLTLTKLDSDKAPIGTWSSPDFHGIETALEEFIRTEEFSTEHCKQLVSELTRTHAVA